MRYDGRRLEFSFLVFGILDDFAGPLAGLCTAETEGRLDCIKYLNEREGGIAGHPIKTTTIDHKMDSTLVISGWDRLKAEGAVVVLSTSAVAVAVRCSKHE